MTKEELEEIEHDALNKMEDVVKTYDGYPEDTHREYDKILIDILKKIGMDKVVDKFDKQAKWYA